MREKRETISEGRGGTRERGRRKDIRGSTATNAVDTTNEPSNHLTCIRGNG